MDRPTVYIETSVVSYLAARSSRHPVTAGRQAMTHAWWARRERYSLVTSSVTIEEVSRGDPTYAARRLHLLAEVRRLEATAESDRLAHALLDRGGLPRRAIDDARQIAVAAVYRIDRLVSWDLAHITNSALRARMERVCRLHGYELPVLGPPHDLPWEAR